MISHECLLCCLFVGLCYVDSCSEEYYLQMCVCGHYMDKVVRFYYCHNGNAMFSDIIRFLSGAFGSPKKGCFGS